MTEKQRRATGIFPPGVEGWVTAEPEPRLVGRRCSRCGTHHFPPTVTACRNPACRSAELADVALSRTGTLWSYTVNRFPPPPPYPAIEPFDPYGVAAVELADEGLVILAKIAADVDVAELTVGVVMELTVEDDVVGRIWKWRPGEG